MNRFVSRHARGLATSKSPNKNFAVIAEYDISQSDYPLAEFIKSQNQTDFKAYGPIEILKIFGNYIDKYLASQRLKVK